VKYKSQKSSIALCKYYSILFPKLFKLAGTYWIHFISLVVQATCVLMNSGIPRNFVLGGSTNSVEDRGQRKRGSGGSSPLAGVPLSLQISEICILIRLLWMYFPWNWEFGSALSKLRNFWGREVEHQPPLPLPSVRHC
jgi:hypothetical protein